MQKDYCVLVIIASGVDDYRVFPIQVGSARDKFLREGVED